MKIPTGWKIIFYIFALLGLFQVYELGFYLINRPDSFLANLGLVLFGGIIASTIYCLFQVGKNAVLFVKEVEKGKEETKC